VRSLCVTMVEEQYDPNLISFRWAFTKGTIHEENARATVTGIVQKTGGLLVHRQIGTIGRIGFTAG
jgi:hypothetical protein